MKTLTLNTLRTAALLIACISPLKIADGAWTVSLQDAAVINTSASAAGGLSGLAYLGDAGGVQQFQAVQDSSNLLHRIDVTLDANGGILSAATIDSVMLSIARDYEGIALSSDAGTAYISDESVPGVFEFDLNTGNQLQSLPIAPVFANTRPNRGFESLTRSGQTLWTANEEALTVDGGSATLTNGTTVRLQQYDISGGTPALGAQFAYEVDPIHSGNSTSGGVRSGLVELVTLPDGSLLALERSLGITSSIVSIPQFESRLYRLDFDGATDVSGLGSGLVG